jgi:hypothetical protein
MKRRSCRSSHVDPLAQAIEATGQFRRRSADLNPVNGYAFSSVGSALMVNPELPGGRPTMFICGDDAAAKQQVTQVLDRFGWEVEDLGAVEAARAIEPLCMLWCIPGLRQNRWTHAFKLLKK